MDEGNVSLTLKVLSPEGLSANTSVTVEFKAPGIFVSNEFFSVFATVVDVWICLAISSMGVVTNILNLIVFFKQGFKDSVGITMTAIAFWDGFKCLTGVLHRCYGPISWFSPALAFSWKNITFISLAYTHFIAGYVSYVMAGYVALERCLCVTIPFKVKQIVTPKLALIVSISISIIVYSSFSVVYLVYEVKWVYKDEYKSDVAIYQYNSFYYKYGQSLLDMYKLLGFIYPVITLVVMVVCTVIIVYQLQKSSKFRSKSGSGGTKTDSKQELSTRDKQVVKMLLVIILIYLINLFPRVVNFIAMLAEPEYYALKKYHNIFFVCIYSIFILDFLNSSVNLFVFLSMSTNFRETFWSIFSFRKKV